MKDKLGPWTPAIFCAFLSLITVTGNLFVGFTNGVTPSSGIDGVFYCFLPMCFYFVGALLSTLQRENRELRTRIEGLASQRRGEEHAV
jgi:hypothetical protein